MPEETTPLATLLRCLDREDVSELQLISGRVVGALRNGAITALTRVPLTTANIEALVEQTPLSAALLANNPLPQALDVSIAGRPLRCVLSRRQGMVQLRIGRRVTAAVPAAEQSAATEKADAPLPALKALPSAADLAASVVAGVQRSAEPPSQGAVLDSLGPGNSSAHGPEGTSVPPVQKAETLAEQGEVVPSLMTLLEGAWRQNASDVHLMADAPMRFRRAGQLEPVGEVLAQPILEPMLLALLGASEKQVLLGRGYVDKAIATAHGRLRLNLSRNAQGLKASLRLVPWQVPSLESLGLPKELLAVGRMHQGLVVVAGPTGHGKTTTLAAMVDTINEHAAHHIITVEDPIEYVHPLKQALMTQRQVGLHTQSFARALKASLREDPDIIVIGELRDRETVEIALGAAETGHLVLTSMNTRSASRAIDRLIDLFPPEDQTQVRTTLGGALKLVVGQKLLPAIGGGLVPACEMISQCLPLTALIRDAKLFQLPSLMQRGRAQGMLKLDTSLLELVRQGKITEASAKLCAEHPSEFERALNASNAAPRS